MPRQPLQRRSAPPAARRLPLAVGVVALFALAPGVSPASAASIEGVWSFNAGKIAIQSEPGGTFSGTVVAPTRFAQCTHPVGQEIWSEMRPQSDGSYWGLHKWYFATNQCALNQSPGQTAWRVLKSPNGGRFLRVCFSEPGVESQPTISASGADANDTFGCSDSALIAALPSVSQRDVGRYLRLPGNDGCLRRRAKLTIHIRDPKNDPITKVVVKLRSGSVHRSARLSHGKSTTVARLNLRGLPQPSFTVTVNLTTALGNHLQRKRTYGICAPTHRRHRRRHGAYRLDHVR
jgi:hypothetical protein